MRAIGCRPGSNSAEKADPLVCLVSPLDVLPRLGLSGTLDQVEQRSQQKGFL